MTSSIVDLAKRGLKNPSAIPRFLRREILQKSFPILQPYGIHVVPNHFYYPIPDTDELYRKQPWEKKYPNTGINLSENQQLELLKEFESYFNELSFSGTGMIGQADGTMLYAMVRELQPNRIIEVGSGTSTRLMINAINNNSGSKTSIISIEPFPDESLRELEEDNENLTLLESKAENVDVDEYLQLGEDDILFIDSSHQITIGNDVAHLYLKVLPQLSKGVYVHSHDIFFPSEYPKEWILNRHRFWTEQYLLQTFLMFNNSFDVVWSGHHIFEEYEDQFKKRLPEADSGGTSFWIKRVD